MSSSGFGGKALELMFWLGSQKILILVYIFNQIIPNIFDPQTRTNTEPDFSREFGLWIGQLKWMSIEK